MWMASKRKGYRHHSTLHNCRVPDRGQLKAVHGMLKDANLNENKDDDNFWMLFLS